MRTVTDPKKPSTTAARDNTSVSVSLPVFSPVLRIPESEQRGASIGPMIDDPYLLQLLEDQFKRDQRRREAIARGVNPNLAFTMPPGIMGDSEAAAAYQYDNMLTSPIGQIASSIAGTPVDRALEPVVDAAIPLISAFGRGLRSGTPIAEAVPLATQEISPSTWRSVVARANELLEEGMGIKKGDAKIELIADEVHTDGSGYPTFDIKVNIDGKHTGFMSFDPMNARDAQMVQTQRTMAMGEETPIEFGLIRQDDFPFGNTPGPEQGQGYSAEMSKALSEALKENGYRLFSSDTHTEAGMARYMAGVERGDVEPIMYFSERRLSSNPEIAEQQRKIFGRELGSYEENGIIYVPDTRFRYNKNGGRVGESWPPDDDIYPDKVFKKGGRFKIKKARSGMRVKRHI